ncbi:hypothetical protein [Sneathiella aquimaris]|uniref:hypothetical protein n=1 Tax=Sneathiella aquimaris TaxID=2599305 RepID=UPI001469FF2C|nr:hypothetical protein [Sneathiella aquimaris]
MKKFSVMAAMIAVLSVGITTTSLAQNAHGNLQCDANLQEAQSGIDLAGKSVRAVSILDRLETHASGSIVNGKEYWVSFRECKGNLVVIFDRNCALENMYTTGNCTIETLPSY